MRSNYHKNGQRGERFVKTPAMTHCYPSFLDNYEKNAGNPIFNSRSATVAIFYEKSLKRTLIIQGKIFIHLHQIFTKLKR